MQNGIAQLRTLDLVSSPDVAGVRTCAAATHAEQVMVACMRMVLALAALLMAVINPSPDGPPGASMIAFAYLFCSILVLASMLNGATVAYRLPMHWVDTTWYGLLVFFSGGSDSIFFLFFFFSILCASFQHGREAGVRVSLACAGLFALAGLLENPDCDLAGLLLRTAFLLALGYMSAQWGECKLVFARRLNLLREVSGLNNPRMGADHALQMVLNRTAEFFDARACLLVLRDVESGAYAMRTVRSGAHTVQGIEVAESSVAPLLELAGTGTASFNRRTGLIWRSVHGSSEQGTPMATVADLLECDAFLTTPVQLGSSAGRLFVIMRRPCSRGEAFFLAQLMNHAAASIDSLALLDRLASEAASEERRRIGLDLHDATLQPYIGLGMALAALRNKAEPGNPLLQDIERLSRMSAEVIQELRATVCGMGRGVSSDEHFLIAAIRRRTLQIKHLHGIDIRFAFEGKLQVGDRVASELLNLVREGLSNICKHSGASRGCVRICNTDHSIHIVIEDEGGGGSFRPFAPRSLAERTKALGGSLTVGSADGGGSRVKIVIPV